MKFNIHTTAPFLKWPGGKRWLLPYIHKFLSKREFNRYFEPFLGSGAVFFGICPPKSFLSDINNEVVNVYLQVRDNPQKIITELQKLPVNKQTYLSIRSEEPECKIKRAVRMLYLNRTAFSGMYRLNKEGKFNVPYGGGRTPDFLWNKNIIHNTSKTLQTATIRHCDFGEIVHEVKAGDLIYFDPTYTTAHNNNGFIRYNEKNFTWADQRRLASLCEELYRRNATIIVSNAYHPDIANLYPTAKKQILTRKSLICPIPSKRKLIKEYLFLYSP